MHVIPERDKLISLVRLQTYLLFLLYLSLFSCCYVVSGQLVRGIVVAKIFYFHLVGSIIVLLSVVYVLLQKSCFTRLKVSINLLDIGVILYISYTLIRILVNFRLPWHSEYLISHLLLLGIYFIFKHSLLRQNRVEIGLICLLIVALGEVLYGGLQNVGYLASLNSSFIVSGSFFNPAPYAGFLVSILPIALSVVINRNQLSCENSYLPLQPGKVTRILALLVLTGTVIILPTTQSRAAWLAALVSTIFVLAHRFRFVDWLRRRLYTWSKKLIALTILLLTGGGLAIILFQLRPGSALGRLLIGKINLRIIADHPIFGVGYDQYQSTFGAYQAAYFAHHPNDPLAWWAGNGEYAFNTLMHVAVEQGLVGLALFGGLLTVAFRLAFRMRSNLSIAAGSSLLAILVFGLFSYPFSVLPIQIVFFYLLSFLSAHQPKFNRPIFLLNYSKGLYCISSLFIVTLLSLLVRYEIKRYCAYREWSIANEHATFFNYKEANEIYERAYPMLCSNGLFLMDYGRSLYYNKEYVVAVEVLENAKHRVADVYLYTTLGNSYQALQQYTCAEKNYKLASNLNPYRFYPKYLLAKLRQEAGDTASAIAVAQEVLSMNIKVPSSTVETIREEMQALVNRKKPNTCITN